jgi:DNA-directed RNA polymerase subunit F
MANSGMTCNAVCEESLRDDFAQVINEIEESTKMAEEVRNRVLGIMPQSDKAASTPTEQNISALIAKARAQIRSTKDYLAGVLSRL